MIDAAFRARAKAALAAAEREEDVRILLAVESGSRAWGFASRDSDYDVRFIFVRPPGAYLRVAPPRDVIERPIDEALDLGGWDLRKALGLMLRSNATVGEWLASPVVYREEPAAVAELRALAHEAAHIPALKYHYDRLARGAWTPGDEDIRLKSYYYALRPVLALRWLRDRGTPPPWTCRPSGPASRSRSPSGQRSMTCWSRRRSRPRPTPRRVIHCWNAS